MQYLAKIPPLCPFLSSYQGRVFLLGFEIVLEITSFIDFLVLDLNRAEGARRKIRVLHCIPRQTFSKIFKSRRRRAKKKCTVFSKTLIYLNRAEGALKNGILHCITCQKPFKSTLKLHRKTPETSLLL